MKQGDLLPLPPVQTGRPVVTIAKSTDRIVATVAAWIVGGVLFSIIGFVLDAIRLGTRSVGVAGLMLLFVGAIPVSVALLRFLRKPDPLITLSAEGIRAESGVMKNRWGFGSHPLFENNSIVPWSNVRFLPRGPRLGNWTFIVSGRPIEMPEPPAERGRAHLRLNEDFVLVHGVFERPLREVADLLHRFKRHFDLRSAHSR